MSSESAAGVEVSRIPTFYNQAQPTERTNGFGVKIFNDEIETFLLQTHNLATEVLSKSTVSHERSLGKVRVRPYVWVSTPVIVPVHTGIPVRRVNEPGTGLRVVAGVVGGIFGGYALFKLGESLAHIKQASEEISDLDHFRNRIDGFKTEWRILTRDNGAESRRLKKLEKIAQCKNNIFLRIRRKSHLDIALLVGIVVASVLAIVGAFVASWPMLTAALGTALVIGGVMLLKWGIDSAAKGHDKDAKEIIRNVESLWNENKREVIPAN